MEGVINTTVSYHGEIYRDNDWYRIAGLNCDTDDEAIKKIDDRKYKKNKVRVVKVTTIYESIKES